MYPKSKCINNNVSYNFNTAVFDLPSSKFSKLREGYNGFICPNGQIANWCDPTSPDYKIDNSPHVEGMNYALNNINDDMCDLDDLNQYQMEMETPELVSNEYMDMAHYVQNTQPNRMYTGSFEENMPEIHNYRHQNLMDNANIEEQYVMLEQNKENFNLMNNVYPGQEYITNNGNKTTLFFMIVIAMLFIFLVIVNIVVASAVFKCIKNK